MEIFLKTLHVERAVVENTVQLSESQIATINDQILMHFQINCITLQVSATNMLMVDKYLFKDIFISIA